MAVIKCKMCGGDLNIIPGETVAECEYCGSRQTVPAADSEKKLTLFARANRLRAGCEFDKAAGIYESIVADFPEEAEAYWGLVLCKYGIEYVDDPATGKKVPTCHRSSFDSVMEDSDLEQALENADAIARKVYREEAKQIEEIRKGIIDVSGREQPYDIFICYKETDESGERTLDSVLAQDVYDALTDKGYRVFFSRITLEDKLGQEYEPYIFAALNSAKIMLAFGTDYEYFNAVWVKNEWSRYLKLMAKDKTKHLIPCYKGIDAYDMPKEFARLQAQDMGKVGAMQDLLRGIEKILPKAAPVTVVQERVVVGGSGDNKIASLLDRGNMALEDGDWAKADSFFEDVLNNDSKNAQAYVGKALAQEKCRTLDALIRKRKEATQNDSTEKLSLERDTTHIEQAARKYSIPGYVEPNSIRELYNFDLSYPSGVSHRKRQYQEEESWWENHRWLSRAEKFASGAVAQTLREEKQRLFAQLAERVKNAENAESAAIAQRKNAYAAHITQADAKAEKQYQDGLARREADYESWLGEAKTETNPHALQKLASRFDGLGDFRDSPALAEQCRKRSDEEQAKIDAERKRQRELAEQERKARQKKNKTLAILAAAAALVVIIAAVVVTQVIIPGNRYKAAEALLAEGHYEEAAAAFEALGNFKDSPDRVLEAHYATADALLAAERYEEAAAAFDELGNYKDSPDRVLEAHYSAADALLTEGNAARAAMVFSKLGNYQDARQRCMEYWDIAAVRDVVSAGAHTVGLKADGTVVAVGDNEYGQCDVSDWRDIVAVSAGGWHTVGLKSDGTVVAVGRNTDWDYEYCGQCDVSDWTDIVAISTGTEHTVGLKSDGTVVATGSNTDWNGEYCGQCDVSGWTDIVAISAGERHTVGLKSDGTVVAVGWNGDGQCDVSDWQDIVTISAVGDRTVGLKSDGTVVAVGLNEDGLCDVSDWRDIVAVSAGYCHTVGLKSDGTVVAVGRNTDWDYEYCGQCDVSDWRDIVAVSAGGWHTVGLKSDGTVVATGRNTDWFGEYCGQCDVSNWTDIAAIYTSGYYTVGLKSDGTVVAVGNNEHGQCDVSSWSDIKVPAKP